MDCEFQALSFSGEGYVVRCRHCGQFQVAFITTVLSLTEAEFRSFCDQTCRVLYEQDSWISRNGGGLFLQTPLQGVCICLRHFEAVRLHSMLESAEAEFEAQSLLNLFRG